MTEYFHLAIAFIGILSAVYVVVRVAFRAYYDERNLYVNRVLEQLKGRMKNHGKA